MPLHLALRLLTPELWEQTVRLSVSSYPLYSAWSQNPRKPTRPWYFRLGAHVEEARQLAQDRTLLGGAGVTPTPAAFCCFNFHGILTPGVA